MLGVVLNKVDLKKLGRYGAYQGSPEYAKYAQKYFATSQCPQTGLRAPVIQMTRTTIGSPCSLGIWPFGASMHLIRIVS